MYGTGTVTTEQTTYEKQIAGTSLMSYQHTSRMCFAISRARKRSASASVAISVISKPCECVTTSLIFASLMEMQMLSGNKMNEKRLIEQRIRMAD